MEDFGKFLEVVERLPPSDRWSNRGDEQGGRNGAPLYSTRGGHSQMPSGPLNFVR